ncbi:MAG: HAMP domain-containing sensor histidine kinase [Elusimicrobiaceae bacterium]|nr:HAMP domain-containing sensor histidine kinase [Elusimicrobiaceae bacterium]
MEHFLKTIGIIELNAHKKGKRVAGFVPQFYQPMFILFVIAIALFARSSGNLTMPQLLYWLGAFMALNIAANRIMGRYILKAGAVDALITTNCFLISAVVHYSGGLHSDIWILYLLPIFTAAMVLSTRELVSATILSGIMMSLFYGKPSEWDIDIAFELAIKSSLFFVGAYLMRSMVLDKNKIATALEEERRKLDEVEENFAEQNLKSIEAANMVEVGKMTSGVVHDLGTPMSVILGSARMMMKDGTFNKADLQRIIDAALLCKNIITNTMQVVRGEDYKFDVMDIRDPLESSAAVTMPLLTRKNIQIIYAYQDILPPIRGSYGHLERLFLNIFTNAKNIMKDGGEIYVNIKVSPDRKWVIITVEDTGPGFPLELVTNGPTAFKTGRKAEGGTGLGLVMCKEVVEKHNGVFRLSNTNKGARIDIHIPVKTETPAVQM